MAGQPQALTTEESQLSGENLSNQTSRLGIQVEFDPEALRKKYAAEKTRRDHNGGLAQYITARDANIIDYDCDPYATATGDRPPVDRTFDVVVIGAGYTGLPVAGRLLENGINNVCMIEKGGGVGGTWYWNRYPGIQCDIESYIYMPLLEKAETKPTRKYAAGTELLQHAKNLAEKFGTNDHTLFLTQVTKVTWIEEEFMWAIETNRHDKIKTRWVISAGGAFQAPKFPGVPGIEKFQGRSFHSSRWDYEYTGGGFGNPTLDKLADKRVAVIGTGATAVQIVPQVANWAQKMYVIQRTPSTIDIRGNQDTDKDWYEKLPKGWQRERQDNFNQITSGVGARTDMVSDGWTTTLRELPAFASPATGGDETPEERALKVQIADMRKMESLRRRIESVVKDKKTAERLKPWYNLFCKRPCFHDEYLEAFNKPSVELIDSKGAGVEAITEHGIVIQGVEYPVDCIIYATGYEWGGTFEPGSSKLNIIGRNGQTIFDKFSDGALIVHGCSVRGFPNLSLLGFTQAGVSPNATTTIMEMTEHITYLIKEFKGRGIKCIEPNKEMEDAWLQNILEEGKARKDFLRECVAGYYNNEGDTSDKLTRSLQYGGGFYKFRSILRGWRAANQLGGMELVYQHTHTS